MHSNTSNAGACLITVESISVISDMFHCSELYSKKSENDTLILGSTIYRICTIHYPLGGQSRMISSITLSPICILVIGYFKNRY